MRKSAFFCRRQQLFLKNEIIQFASLALVGNPSSDGVMIKMLFPLRLSNPGLMSSGDILTSGEKVPL